MFTDYKFFIFSENPDSLVKFYTDALGFSITEKLDYPQDYGYSLEIAPGGRKLWLAEHSKVQGKNKDPYRTMLNLYTDNVEEVFQKAIAWEGVEVIAKPFHMTEMNPDEHPERIAATLLDPDGNCIQIMSSPK